MANKYLPLFQPIRLGNMVLKNRIVMAPMGEGYGGSLCQQSVDYYAERARGGAAMIIPGACISTRLFKNSTLNNLTDAQTRRYMPFLAEAVHAGGSKLCIEFTAGPGRNAPDAVTGESYAPSADDTWAFVPDRKCVEITREQIKQIMDDTRDCAAFVKSAGADCIDIHAHNGYLIDEFITSCWNHRTDEYGGSIENRMRFLLEYIDAIRQGVGPGFPIIVRFTIDMCAPDHREEGETEEMLRIMSKADIQALDVDAACYESFDKIFPPYYYGDACELYVTDTVKKLGITLPILNAGNHTPDSALQALLDGKLDIAMMGRALIADPQLPNKLLAGKPEEVRPCLKCNMGCLTKNTLRGMSCAVNAETGIERDARMVGPCKGQKVVVIGGGPAGLEAARKSAERGAEVTLLEKSGRLGGTARDIASPDWKYRFRQLFDWYELQMKKLGVKVVLNADVTADSSELRDADRIFVATGSDPIVPSIEGIRGENVHNVLSVHRDMSLVKGDNVVVCGGGMSGCEMALELAEHGKHVTVVDMLPSLATDAAAANGMTLMIKLAQNGVVQMPNTTVKRFTPDGVVVESNGAEQTLAADTVIHAFGIKSNNSLGLELMSKYPGRVLILGDANRIDCIFSAVHDGYNAALSLE